MNLYCASRFWHRIKLYFSTPYFTATTPGEKSLRPWVSGANAPAPVISPTATIPSPTATIPSQFLDNQRNVLAARIERYRRGITSKAAFPGQQRVLQATLATLEGELAVFDRLHEDATLATLKAAVNEIESRRAGRTS